MKKHVSLARRLTILFGFLVLSVISSQCFAESSSESSKNADSKKYLGQFSSLYDWIQKTYVDEVDPAVLYRGALKGMLSELADPYTTYLDESLSRNLGDTTNGQFGGVGLSISKAYESTPDKPAYIEVASPIEDTPGFKAGIQAGDLIISVNGTDTSTISMEEVLGMLRGKVGESVDLVIRRGKNIEFPVTLKRAVIEVPTVKFGTIETGAKNKIGYLKIIEFTPLTPEKTQEALNSFKKSGVSSLIIDLRNNPGGLITSVADVADKFIDNGPIVSTKSRVSYENSVFTASKRKTVWKDTPIVVLINRGSASAAEILSGALKDNHLAYLVGQRSYGKGSVQQVLPLTQTEGIKITVARYYTPSDVNIDKIGIPPDREILFPALSENGEKQFEDLMEKNLISAYVEKNGGAEMSEKKISEYAKTLKKTYTEIDEASLRKLIRNEVYKTKGSMLYDLDYDIQLDEAIKILEKEDFDALIKSAKTLKELQDDAQLEDSSKK